MPTLKAKQVRQMSVEERAQKLRELQNELVIERGKAATHGGGRSAGRVNALRKQVARVRTVMREKNEG
ncbi:MAG TPA: 50S ribosomal protein L29 [Candidatus Thermoplasmatota archaeon]|uniref:Large ribosomal subunit protein uL29 n=1 Tax=uncultured euryarchaeote Rifle_16ft_4_minimus_14142 TaxID=1665188 RepID=A0A0H4T3V1_9EURY|nr:ribosomal protein L29, large subunit ribosomal protein L29 [uncultured euryarchaeote Rifle_16ft_4_minimus_14142]HKZ59891.1 50S ribosomal protein L29 [Candidatus Thermoplasmatota archaeon]